MQIGIFEINIKDNILIVTSKKNVTLDNLKELHTLMEENTGNGYSCGIYRDILGYYDGFDFKNNILILYVKTCFFVGLFHVLSVFKFLGFQYLAVNKTKIK